MPDTATDKAQYANLLLYIESCYEIIGKPVPKKEGGGIDVLKCKAYLIQLAYQGMIPAYEVWHKQMFGVNPDGGDGWEWPDQSVMPWPPFKAIDARLESIYGG